MREFAYVPAEDPRRRVLREDTVVVLQFSGEMTQTEIAQRLGISQMHVSRLLTRSLQLLCAQQAGGGTDN